MRNVGDDIRRYVKAYNHKINPIMLIISSTVLGLLPFLSDGPEEVFWFDFAIGTISGMVFSVIALIFILPAFVIRPPRRSRRSSCHPDRMSSFDVIPTARSKWRDLLTSDS